MHATEIAVRKGLQLEYITLSYNVIEAVVAILSGAAASSTALLGFGIDSVIEVSSGLIMIWRLSQRHPAAEARAQKLIALSFAALGTYVLYESVEGLWQHEAPEKSWPGIALAALSLIVMPMLARAKRGVGRTICSPAMVADSQQTQLCAYLSAILLAGLGLHALLGWWWADAVAGLVMTPIIYREGWSAWRGQGCGCAH